MPPAHRQTRERCLLGEPRFMWSLTNTLHLCLSFHCASVGGGGGGQGKNRRCACKANVVLPGAGTGTCTIQPVTPRTVRRDNKKTGHQHPGAYCVPGLCMRACTPCPCDHICSHLQVKGQRDPAGLRGHSSVPPAHQNNRDQPSAPRGILRAGAVYACMHSMSV